MQQLLKTFKKRLTNLSARNRSLLLLKPFKRQFFDLHQLDFEIQKPSFDILQELISGKKSILISKNLDPRDGKTNELGKHLSLISRTDRTLQAERGAKDLYLGYPIIKGKLLNGNLVRCPLLFFPVSLQLDGNDWRLEKRPAEISFNRSFLMAYSHFNKIKLGEELLEKSPDDFSSNPKEFLIELYEYIKASKLEINFNSELFNQKLQNFESLKQEDFEQEKSGELKLFPQAVLGIFPQTGSYISSDYDELLKSDFGNNQEGLDAFLNTSLSKNTAIREEHLHLPLAVDASQEEAIKQIKAGKSLVIQGPPGTGKSQLICNLMADYAAKGKRVLLVCQKRAALDTVYQRLGEIGMQKFAAIIHDFKADRKDLYAKIAEQKDNILAYKHENQSLNAIFLDREFAAVCRKTDKVLLELENFKKALFDRDTYGKSIKELYLLANHQKNKELDFKEQFPFFHFSTLNDYLNKLDNLEKYKNELVHNTEKSIFWHHRKDFARFTSEALVHTKQSLADISSLKDRLNSINGHFKLENAKEKNQIINYFENVKSIKQFEDFKSALSNSKKVKQLNKLITEVAEISLLPMPKSIFEKQELENMANRVNVAFENNSNALKGLFWKVFSKEKRYIHDLLNTFGLSTKRKDLSKLSFYISQLLRIKEISHSIAFDEINVDANSLTSELKEQESSHLVFHQLNTSFPYILIDLPEYDKDAFDHKMQEWLSIINDIETKHTNWQKFLLLAQIEALNSGNYKQILSFIDAQFENIHGRDLLFSELTKVEQDCYLKTMSKFDADYSAYFLQNLILHLIDDLELKNPILRSVSSLKMKLWEEELQDLVLKKRKFSKDYLLLKLRENTYKNIEQNRLGNATTYRDLYHQCSKKKQIWPVRKLVDQFKEELFDLVPCWMASPETVSALFPLSDEPLFDLVIFDEASQCFSENGLPAMLRGKQVVIAGDKMQLQPNDLYKIKMEEEGEDNPILEIESLLQLASQYMPENILRGHYRSKSLDLIDFSNQHFYQNKLKLLPDFNEINQGNPAINFIEINGIWDQNKNQIEAEKVLETIRHIQPSKSIGVVTFNYHQAELIQDMCQEFEHVSVKNIENIQGDEFDIVIFSITYAKDKKGKLNMNFGSLNQKGGENRLNVAITRAKEKVFVISSISANDLHIENAQNKGPKLLKAYLQYAKDVSTGAFKPSISSPKGEMWAKQLKNEMCKSDESFSKELPFVDLVQKNKLNFGKTILTDDQYFYAAESLKESFAYLPLTLEKKGWTYQRSWSRNWWQDKESTLSLLLEEKVKKQ